MNPHKKDGGNTAETIQTEIMGINTKTLRLYLRDHDERLELDSFKVARTREKKGKNRVQTRKRRGVVEAGRADGPGGWILTDVAVRTLGPEGLRTRAGRSSDVLLNCPACVFNDDGWRLTAVRVRIGGGLVLVPSPLAGNIGLKNPNCMMLICLVLDKESQAEHFVAMATCRMRRDSTALCKLPINPM